MLKRYVVISPIYEVTSMSWDPPEPPDYGCDYIEVEAGNKQEAKIFAVKLWRAELKNKPWERRYIDYYDDENPFANLTVKEISNDTT